ncbi:IS66 family transposase zinc-finger binding domain-containing protein [Flavobacterium sp. CS20]|uniref:IS66 family transposase zinc-finger binding domain-containing protein n=1 Tax=Flavobacterium sp. CS20 TaxID=2775246 RepID=UPI001B39DAB9|nr:IS66 family transposase zinc-finger binding domain-containing protein [Flavobacterium sp. CS20]QTY26855.1 IS66 family transposase zinc-finger binding domain-containing protein [Flavobacterium sp. CS20]
MVEIPDVTEEHIPDYCNCCGNDLSSLPHQYAGSRQVFDIPEIKIKVTEHKVYKKFVLAVVKQKATIHHKQMHP